MANSHHNDRHSHDHDHHHHHHHNSSERALIISLVLTLLFAVAEVFGGWLSGSLALISDAGHMVSDAFALGLAAIAAWISRRPPSPRHTFGLARAEVIAASLNGLLMLGVVGWICYEALDRLYNPQPVQGLAVMAIAGLGLAVNLLVARILSKGSHDMNSRAALLHVLGDILGSVAALVAGAVIYVTDWLPIDPLLSLLVAGLVLSSTVRLLRDALNVLMEAVPASIELEIVGTSMAKVEGVVNVHDLHIWTLATGKIALSAHIELASLAAWPSLLKRLQTMLHESFDIDHVTLQPEITPFLSPRDGKVIQIHERQSK
ncbi:MAG TPA: cation diffusion facilitator family transporter [Burkholderiales bacterium]|nr:cation diffusion facilitator family transporter [Burkholderiales bacterium]